MDLSKKEKRELRELVGQCYEQHLEEHLEELYEDFQKWGGKHIGAVELTDRIHKFHDGAARELYKMYIMTPPEIAIIYAIRNKIITKDELETNIIKKLASHLELLEKHDQL